MRVNFFTENFNDLDPNLGKIGISDNNEISFRVCFEFENGLRINGLISISDYLLVIIHIIVNPSEIAF